uniref:Cytochrome c oxidase subunit 1 n=1 Tax=Wuchereria bancrofti TaxID=6293 RepID=A0A1I8ERR2_WUCBA
MNIFCGMTFGNVLKQSIINTVNHKTIGTYYIVLAGLGGSVLSIIIRFKLSSPGVTPILIEYCLSWTFYPPLRVEGQPEVSLDVIILGLHTVGIGFLLGAINFIVTTQNMLSVAETSFLLVLSVPLLAGPLLFLLFDQVYVIILPVFGIINEAVLSLIDKDRLFGQTSITFTSIWIAVLGTSVWGHHVYTTGLDIDTRVANFNIAKLNKC